MVEYDVPCDRDDVLCRAIVNSILKSVLSEKLNKLRIVREVTLEELKETIKTEAFPLDKVRAAYEVELSVEDASKLELRTDKEGLNRDVRIPYVMIMRGILVEYDKDADVNALLGAFGEETVAFLQPIGEEGNPMSVHVTSYKLSFDFDEAKEKFLEFSKAVKERKEADKEASK